MDENVVVPNGDDEDAGAADEQEAEDHLWSDDPQDLIVKE
jgi:hypothetical protein